MLLFVSLGCGIGYGYLHRIPTRYFPEGRKMTFSAHLNAPVIPAEVLEGVSKDPLLEGFAEVGNLKVVCLTFITAICV